MGWSLGVIKVKCLLWGVEYSPWFHHWNLWLCPTEEAVLLPVFTSLLHCLHFSSLTRMETKLRSDKWGLWELPRSICIKLVRSIATISLNHLSCSHRPPGRTHNTERHSGEINYEVVVCASVGDPDLLCTKYLLRSQPEDLQLENDCDLKSKPPADRVYFLALPSMCVSLYSSSVWGKWPAQGLQSSELERWLTWCNGLLSKHKDQGSIPSTHVKTQCGGTQL